MLGERKGGIMTHDDGRLKAARQVMLDEHLVARGIHDPRVLAAMASVRREEFVPPHLRELAYDDRALPVELGQTISQPYTVAFMAQAARLTGHERVLEVGTGTGYGAAILSQLAAEVCTVERWPDLVQSARERLQWLCFRNVRVQLGDGSLGWPKVGPFDAIVVTAAAVQLPPAFLGQLAEEGRIIIPIGEPGNGQTMFRFIRRGDEPHSESLGQFSFVPLVCEPT